MPSAERRLVTAGLLLGIFLGALEATVVGTAMPTIVASLGGLEHYSWVFSAYLLTSTASVPIWGRLSDLHGRRPFYLLSTVVFLAGSALAGAAQSLPQLIVFRAIQGLGAGGLIPLALTIIGEIYTLAERARMQALFSGVWGVASIAGPLVGGYVTDVWSWRWVFYLNLPFGILGAAIIGRSLPAAPPAGATALDWRGAALLFATVSLLLFGLSGIGRSWPWLAAAVVAAAVLARVERQSATPMFPIALLSNPIVVSATTSVFLLGMAMFGAIAFVPLFAQGAMDATATQAGQLLTPLFLGWVITSVVGARIVVRVGFRRTTMFGIVLVAGAFALLTWMPQGADRSTLLVAMSLLGAGLGFCMLALLLVVQHAVARNQLGLATSFNQFARTIGGAIGVAIMGGMLASSLRHTNVTVPVGAEAAASGVALDPQDRIALGAALHRVFGLATALAGLALIPALRLPEIGTATRAAGEQLLAAEMTTLEPEDEPVGVEEHSK